MEEFGSLTLDDMEFLIPPPPHTQIVSELETRVMGEMDQFHQLHNQLTMWKQNQRKAYLSPRHETKQCFDQLDFFDHHTKVMNKHVLETEQQLSKLEFQAMESTEYISLETRDKIFRLRQTLEELKQNVIKYITVVIARQPYHFLIKGTKGDQRKDPHYPCRPVLRILGGTTLLDNMAFSGRITTDIQITVTCQLITELDARAVKQNPKHNCQEFAYFNNSNSAVIGPVEFVDCCAKFEPHLQLTQFDDGRIPELRQFNEDIPWKTSRRFYMLFTVSLGGGSDSKPRLISLPVSAYTGGNLRFEKGSGDAYQWWSLAATQDLDVIMTNPPLQIPWTMEIGEMLENKIRQMLDEPTTKWDPNECQQRIRGLSKISIDHLYNKLCPPNQQGFAILSRDALINSCTEHDWHTNRVFNRTIRVVDKGHNKVVGCTFFRWLYRATQILKQLLAIWNVGYDDDKQYPGVVVAFCSKWFTETYLRPNQMLIRISDRMADLLIICYKLIGSQKTVSFEIDMSKIGTDNLWSTLQSALTMDAGLRQIHFIYNGDVSYNPGYEKQLLLNGQACALAEGGDSSNDCRRYFGEGADDDRRVTAHAQLTLMAPRQLLTCPRCHYKWSDNMFHQQGQQQAGPSYFNTDMGIGL